MPTTFRADISAGIVTVLQAYAAANPDRLRRVYRARPSSVGPDFPCAWVDSRPEDIVHDSGTRTRTMTPSVVVCRTSTDNLETMAAFDVTVDGLVDAFTAVPQFTLGTIWSEMSVADEEIVMGNFLYPAVRFTFSNVSIQEGRD